MPRLLLHIGTHKTGTTSIQRFCTANREALRKHGVWYPPADVGKFPSHYAHHRIAHAIADRDQEFDASDAADYFRRVRKQMRADETCLISAEPMYRHMLPDPYPDGGPARLDADEANSRHDTYAAAVRDCVDGFDVDVLVMLRRQDTFLESLYAEQVMATGYTGHVGKFIDQRETLLDYQARLASWAKAFGDDHISIRVYDPSVRPIEREFVEWIGVDWSDGFHVAERQNVTPSRTLVEFKRMLNDPRQSVPVNTRYRRWIEQLAERFPERFPDRRRSYLQPHERRQLLERFAPANQAIAERYRGGSPLFDDRFTDDMQVGVDRPLLDETDFRAIAQLLLRMIAQEAEA